MTSIDDVSPLFDEPRIPLKCTREYGCSARYKTVQSWARRGVRSRVNGLVHRLETVWEGGILCTSRAAFRRFLIALNAEPVSSTRRKKPRRGAR
jgi:hypothetical protein